MTTFHVSPGSPLPFGSTVTADGVNFAVFSRHAEKMSLVLFALGHEEPLAEIALDPAVNRTGDVWHILVHDLDLAVRYGYRAGGPFDPDGRGHRFSNRHLLLDPYARALSGGSRWGVAEKRKGGGRTSSFARRCLIVADHFDWEGDRPLRIPLQDSIIYEMHVRGFTAHPSSGTSQPGTYGAVVDKIPYLKALGITAVELMPVAEFNELENVNRNPLTGEQLVNFWGYSPLAFFAPKGSYAVDGRHGQQVREFKEMVKALHRAGIEVILDVVFNHTAEGGADGPAISFRGLDNTIYYLLDRQTRDYLNFSGCGNTTNCNHPLVRKLIIDCLRYWVMEMHVDGFRFDLASILGRGAHGEVLSNPPMVEKIGEDPILSHTKIIAEAWDAAGLYQVGSFATGTRWAEWNGRFRDDVRSFMAGQQGMVSALATRIAGSSDLYQSSGRLPYNSINFITSHDGFTLHDLVSYNQKHNEANGENNRDGSNHNISWNSGVEGETENRHIETLRQRRMRSFAVILMLSQGVPMLLAGDEFGRRQQGNNNAYCQDNPIGWVDWQLLEKNADLFRFFKKLIRLRKKHPVFRRTDFFRHSPQELCPEISWQGLEAGIPDWSHEAQALAFMLNGCILPGKEDDDFFVMLNGSSKDQLFSVPQARKGRRWARVIDTALAPPRDIVEEADAQFLRRRKVHVASMAVVVLIAKAGGRKERDAKTSSAR